MVYKRPMTDPAIDAPGRLQQVRYSIECLGWRHTVHELIDGRRPYDPATDLRFDERHATDTAGSVEPEHLGIADDQRRRDAILYLPSPTSITRWMLDEVAVDTPATTFVDLGCGKGRVLLVAAERPFQRVARRRDLRPNWPPWPGRTPSATARRRRCGRRSTCSTPTSRPSTCRRRTC